MLISLSQKPPDAVFYTGSTSISNAQIMAEKYHLLVIFVVFIAKIISNYSSVGTV